MNVHWWSTCVLILVESPVELIGICLFIIFLASLKNVLHLLLLFFLGLQMHVRLFLLTLVQWQMTYYYFHFFFFISTKLFHLQVHGVISASPVCAFLLHLYMLCVNRMYVVISFVLSISFTFLTPPKKTHIYFNVFLNPNVSYMKLIFLLILRHISWFFSCFVILNA